MSKLIVQIARTAEVEEVKGSRAQRNRQIFILLG